MMYDVTIENWIRIISIKKRGAIVRNSCIVCHFWSDAKHRGQKKMYQISEKYVCNFKAVHIVFQGHFLPSKYWNWQK